MWENIWVNTFMLECNTTFDLNEKKKSRKNESVKKVLDLSFLFMFNYIKVTFLTNFFILFVVLVKQATIEDTLEVEARWNCRIPYSGTTITWFILFPKVNFPLMVLLYSFHTLNNPEFNLRRQSICKSQIIIQNKLISPGRTEDKALFWKTGTIAS